VPNIPNENKGGLLFTKGLLNRVVCLEKTDLAAFYLRKVGLISVYAKPGKYGINCLGN
jgi:hypothetical protein